MNIIQFFTRKKFKNAEMVSYWKTKESVEAKLYKTKDGHYEMKMQGEKYPFEGYPRGVLLFGSLSKLKHEIKNQIFNDAWKLLEDGKSEDEVREYVNTVAWPKVYELGHKARFDMVPFENLAPQIKELYRAMTVVGVENELRDIICFILQEDDAYRMRFQWMVKFFPWWRKPTVADFEKAFTMAEHAEVVSDMKERERLFKRIFLVLVKNSSTFKKFLKEVDWSKLQLTKAHKYFFRAKYFKVDYPEYQY